MSKPKIRIHTQVADHVRYTVTNTNNGRRADFMLNDDYIQDGKRDNVLAKEYQRALWSTMQ